MPLLASITDPIVEWAVWVVGELGLWGIFVLMVLESACIPVPSEATMLFAGFNVSQGQYSLFAITAVGSVANLVGSWLAYAVGYYGRVDWIEKHGRKVGISPKHLRSADRYFERYGDVTVFFTRMLPIIRTFISLPAGVARMPIVRFSVLTLVGCVPWVLMLGWIGVATGERWREWKDSLHYVDYVVAGLIVVGVVWLAVKAWRGGGSDGDEGEEEEPGRGEGPGADGGEEAGAERDGEQAPPTARERSRAAGTV
jgi:membrane protein DedA with SNARE-associated domain